MKLLELSANQASFRKLEFNTSGLTVIVGDGSNVDGREGNSNGVGKTLSLGLTHHCLGANANPAWARALQGWWFYLRISLNGREYSIGRTGDGKKITLDGTPIKIGALRQWLDASGAFELQGLPHLSFRSLVKRFSRYAREDCVDPVKLGKEPDYDGRFRSLYLLGVDTGLVVTKRVRKLSLDLLTQRLKASESDPLLETMFRAGSNPKVRAEWLDREIPRLEEDLRRFQVAEDYRAIELEAGALTREMRALEKRSAVLRFQMDSIQKTLDTHADIGREHLLELYAGLEDAFRPEALKHFEEVERFHQQLTSLRKERLNADWQLLASEERDAQSAWKKVSAARDAKLQSLQGKRALDEYAQTAQQLAVLRAEREQLRTFMNLGARFQAEQQLLREQGVEEDRLAADYVATSPLVKADGVFRELASILYAKAPAGIVLENNTRENQLRYDLTVQIEGDASDGINAARILCFDWLLLLHGRHHSVDFLWHDNRLFADIDPQSRGHWFGHVMKAAQESGKQYVASINTENFDAMLPFLSEGEQSELNSAVRLRLRGDKPEHKLLGIQFGS
jgi:uncharacterized protein YydD (DUF2326 family)